MDSVDTDPIMKSDVIRDSLLNGDQTILPVDTSTISVFPVNQEFSNFILSFNLRKENN